MTSDPIGLAQELHDGIAQDLVGLGYSIDSILAEETDAKNRADLRAVRLNVSSLIDKVRTEIFSLRNSQTLNVQDSVKNTEYELQRVLAEIIRNTIVHAKASELTITVSDNGIGGAQEKPGSYGLKGIQERITNLNGDIQIVSIENGTKIEFTIPLDR